MFGIFTRYFRPQYFRFAGETLLFMPLILGGLIALLLAFLPQMREVYLGIIEVADVRRGVYGLISIATLASVLYAWNASAALRRIDSIYPSHGEIHFDRSVHRIKGFKAGICALLPFLGLLWGLTTSRFEVEAANRKVGSVVSSIGAHSTNISAHLELLREMPFRIVIAGALTFFVALLVVNLMHRIGNSQRHLGDVIAAGILILLLMIAVPMLMPELAFRISRELGPLATIGFVLVSMTMIVSLAMVVAGMIGKGGLMLLSGVLMVMGGVPAYVRNLMFFLAFMGAVFAGWNVLSVREFEAGAGDQLLEIQRRAVPRSEKTIEVNFGAWIKARPDRRLDEPYPVFVVAAQGGGIYAASAIANFMALMQEHCPPFAHHVFATSAVSGGSVGAAIVNGLIAQEGHPPGTDCSHKPSAPGQLSGKVDKVILDDHLSPVVANLLPDMINGLAAGLGLGGEEPLQIEGSARFADRAAFLRESFAQSFAEVGAERREHTDLRSCNSSAGSSSQLDVCYKDLWTPESTSPALIFNATWVETGFRVAFAPFSLKAAGDGTLYSFLDFPAEVTAPEKVSMLDAAVVSARFPFIAPNWSIPSSKPNVPGRPDRWYFVDGGYADNSGVTTALEIYNKLKELESKHNAKIHLVVLTDGYSGVDLKSVQANIYSNLLAPMKALLKVRELLAFRAVSRARSQIDRSGPGASCVLMIELDQKTFPLTLGWKISRTSNGIVRLNIGDPEIEGPFECSGVLAASADAEGTGSAERTIRRNSATMRHIMELLKGSEPSGSARRSD